MDDLKEEFKYNESMKEKAAGSDSLPRSAWFGGVAVKWSTHWTKEMMTKGYPQLQQLYGMLGAKNNVYCRPLLHFPHNSSRW